MYIDIAVALCCDAIPYYVWDAFTTISL